MVWVPVEGAGRVWNCSRQSPSPLRKCKPVNGITLLSLCSTETSQNQLKQIELKSRPVITLELCRSAAVGRNLRDVKKGSANISPNYKGWHRFVGVAIVSN